MQQREAYKARQFNLSGLTGISDQTLEMHFKLYEGYVKNTNLINEQVADIASKGIDKNPLAFAELKRRLGFEYNGMVLHEYYFENLKKGGGGEPDNKSDLCTAIEGSFGSFEDWKKDYAAVGAMRGVGWAICYQDPRTGWLSNHWITLHEDGNVAGFNPVLVMDVWEHAFLLDYKPADRPKYIEAFFSNVDWSAANGRLEKVKSAAGSSGR
jgi:Fe-Mn family superoxide dismutase